MLLSPSLCRHNGIQKRHKYAKHMHRIRRFHDVTTSQVWYIGKSTVRPQCHSPSYSRTQCHGDDLLSQWIHCARIVDRYLHVESRSTIVKSDSHRAICQSKKCTIYPRYFMGTPQSFHQNVSSPASNFLLEVRSLASHRWQQYQHQISRYPLRAMTQSESLSSLPNTAWTRHKLQAPHLSLLRTGRQLTFPVKRYDHSCRYHTHHHGS